MRAGHLRIDNGALTFADKFPSMLIDWRLPKAPPEVVHRMRSLSRDV